jgi:hypothetical protein
MRLREVFLIAQPPLLFPGSGLRQSLYNPENRSMRRLLNITALFIALTSIEAAQLDPKAIHIQLPKSACEVLHSTFDRVFEVSCLMSGVERVMNLA